MNENKNNQIGTVLSRYNKYANFPSLPPLPPNDKSVPDDDKCFSLWDKYEMLPNIKQHSLKVAHIATCLAKKAASSGFQVDINAVRAAALLHDLAKTYTIHYGGSHAQLGAAWVIAETGNHALANGVLFHVFWPWTMPSEQDLISLPFFIIYADKRVRHDTIVTLDERLIDLKARYGRSDEIISHMSQTFSQARYLEKIFSKQLGWRLNEDSFDSGGMVP